MRSNSPCYCALLPHNFHFWCQKTNISRVRRSSRGLRVSRLTSPHKVLYDWDEKKKTSWNINRTMERSHSLSFLLSYARARSEHYHFSCSLSRVHASINANARASSIKPITCSDDSSRMISTTVTVHSVEHNLRATRYHFSRSLKEKLHRYQPK